MGRPANPDTDFKVALRVTGKYRYAATQPHITDENSGKTVRRYVYWGEVSEDLRFIPNSRFILTPESKRKRLIFPPAWDISAIDSVDSEAPEIPAVADPYVANDGSAFTGTVSACPAAGQFNNGLYGGSWFLWQIAVKKHVVEDLLQVFSEQRGIVEDIMTLAMFPILTKYNYSMTERWQKYTKTPSRRSLSPSYITRLTQKITDDHRMLFLKLRIAREGGKAVVACDSTTRSAYGHCLADIRWGNNKDNKELQNTLEVVVYSLSSHEPIYYRTFGGNENDARTLRTIVNDLKALKCGDLTVIFDRGYETPENIDTMILEEQCFLVCGKVSQEPVYSNLCKIKFDQQGMPLDMMYLQEHGIYAIQYETPRTVLANPEDSGSGKNVKLKVNLFLDMKKRIQILTLINEEIKKEAVIVREKDGTSCTEEQRKALSKQLRYYYVKSSKDKRMVISPNEKAIDKSKATAGFFASISYKVDGDALSQYKLYVMRDEQEKYFEAMKDQLGFDVQGNWSEDGKTGRLFILFIALIMRSEIRAVWGERLRKRYPSSLDVLQEMFPIRFVEYDDGSTHVTSFTTPQAEICQAFSIPIPEDCLSNHQKVEIDRAVANRKPGRPKGSLNRKQVRGAL